MRVTLRRQRGAIELTVSDNRAGMSPEDAHLGIGIVGMRDRIEAVGGRLRIVSSIGRGTCIHAILPDEEAAPYGRSVSPSTPACLSRS